MVGAGDRDCKTFLTLQASELCGLSCGFAKSSWPSRGSRIPPRSRRDYGGSRQGGIDPYPLLPASVKTSEVRLHMLKGNGVCCIYRDIRASEEECHAKDGWSGRYYDCSLDLSGTEKSEAVPQCQGYACLLPGSASTQAGPLPQMPTLACLSWRIHWYH